MKKIFLGILVLTSVIGCTANAQSSSEQPTTLGLTATEWVSRITAGWNLGNTLDALPSGRSGTNLSVTQLETTWGNPVTTKENIAALRSAGFNAIRIPVSWAKAADENHNIRPDWMERVVEVVDYAVANDMYIVLNTHHDESIFRFKDEEVEQSIIAFRRIWEQIAERFKYYDHRLVFEALNEPRTLGSPYEWRGGTPEEHANVNAHYQVFVETVRASGGNNADCILMINTYAASGAAIAIDALVLPEDSADDRLIVSIHVYAPYDFTLNVHSPVNTWDRNVLADTRPITNPIDHVYNRFISNGIPVVIGEFGAVCKENINARVEWTKFYVGYANSKGIPCFWWDNGIFRGSGERFGIFDRRTNTFAHPEIVEALLSGIQQTN